MFPRRAEDSLRVLIYLGIIVLFLGVLFLRFDEAATDFNSIQFVGPDAPTQNFIASRFGIEVPFFPALYDRNRKRGKSSLPADTMAWFAFFGAISVEFFSFALAKNVAVRSFVLNGMFGTAGLARKVQHRVSLRWRSAAKRW